MKSTRPIKSGQVDKLDELIEESVRKTGNHQVEGVLNFTNSPKIPDGTQPEDAVNFKQLSEMDGGDTHGANLLLNSEYMPEGFWNLPASGTTITEGIDPITGYRWVTPNRNGIFGGQINARPAYEDNQHLFSEFLFPLDTTIPHTHSAYVKSEIPCQVRLGTSETYDIGPDKWTRIRRTYTGSIRPFYLSVDTSSLIPIDNKIFYKKYQMEFGENLTDWKPASEDLQRKLIAGDNITIENNIISATGTGTATPYTAGDNITIENNIISADVPAPLVAGDNITIENNIISATGTGIETYTAGEGISIENNEIGLKHPELLIGRNYLLNSEYVSPDFWSITGSSRQSGVDPVTGYSWVSRQSGGFFGGQLTAATSKDYDINGGILYSHDLLPLSPTQLLVHSVEVMCNEPIGVQLGASPLTTLVPGEWTRLYREFVGSLRPFYIQFAANNEIDPYTKVYYRKYKIEKDYLSDWIPAVEDSKKRFSYIVTASGSTAYTVPPLVDIVNINTDIDIVFPESVEGKTIIIRATAENYTTNLEYYSEANVLTPLSGVKTIRLFYHSGNWYSM